MTTIPASYSVKVSPSVLGTAGNALDLSGLVLTRSNRVPIGTIKSFPDAASVGNFFGPASNEAVIAGGGTTVGGNPAGTGYFGGYDGSSATPGELLFAQYPLTAVSAYVWGGNAAAALTLAQLQALSGSLTAVIDGYSHVISSINLSSYTSFSAAAAGIQAAFTDPTEATFTAAIGATSTGTASGTTLTLSSTTGLVSVGDAVAGTGVPAGTTIVALGTGTGGDGTYITSQATTASAASLTISSNVLNVTADTDHTIAVGQTVTGAGVAAGTLITAQLSGTAGGIGKYSISGTPQEVASESMTGVATAPTVTFDQVSGAFVITSGITGVPSTAAFATGTLAAPLLLTSATGAVLSQGAAAAAPSTFMNGIIAQNVNWASFFTAFDPDGGTGNAQKLLFAEWTNSVAPRYAYIAWDPDPAPAASQPAASSLGYLVNVTDELAGTVSIYEPTDYNHAAFISGAIAAIDFTEPGGRVTFAYLTQSGLAASVTTLAAAVNLGGNPQVNGSFGNYYNFVGAFGTANQGFINYQRGMISGAYQWLDSYVNQIALTNALQLAAYTYMTQVGSFPYTSAGYSNFETALQGTIDQFLAFGAYSPGVNLSSAQIAQVNRQAGINIASVLQTQGWYLQILPADAPTRASRSSPPITFWYVDGGSVQSLNIGSVSV